MESLKRELKKSFRNCKQWQKLVFVCLVLVLPIAANGASSKKDFKNKIYICRKESNETKHWLRMIAKANEDKESDCRKLWEEAHELILIFAKISKSCSI